MNFSSPSANRVYPGGYRSWGYENRIIIGGTLEMIALGWMNIGAQLRLTPLWHLSFLPFWLSQVSEHWCRYCTGNPSGRCGPGMTIIVRTITVAFQHAADKAAITAT